MILNKYKIGPEHDKEIIAKAGLEKNMDKKEERFKQDQKSYPIKEVDNEKVFEIRMKRIINMFDDMDPRKAQHQKVLDEHKEMLKREKNKKLNEKNKTATNKEDEIENNHPSVTDPEAKIDEKGPNVGTGKQIKADYIPPTMSIKEIEIELNKLEKKELEKEEAFKTIDNLRREIASLVDDKPEHYNEFNDRMREIRKMYEYDVKGAIKAADEDYYEEDLSKKYKKSVRILQDDDKKWYWEIIEDDTYKTGFKSFEEAKENVKNYLENLSSSIKAGGEDKDSEEKIVKEKEIEPKKDKEPKKEKKEKSPSTLDVFDISEGLPLGNGVMAHKDEQTGQIYVLDKNGNELVRTVNAFVNDMGLVIEFYRDLLGLQEEKPEKKVESAETAFPIKQHKEGKQEEEIPELEDDESEEDVDKESKEEIPELDQISPESEREEDELSKKLDELIKVQKEQTALIKKQSGEGEEEEDESEEKLPDKSEEQMLNLQYEIEEKRDKVKSAIQFLIDNDRIDVTSEEINAYRIKGESIIFAKQNAKEAKIRVLTDKLFRASNEYIDMYIEAHKANNKDEADSIFEQLFK